MSSFNMFGSSSKNSNTSDRPPRPPAKRLALATPPPGLPVSKVRNPTPKGSDSARKVKSTEEKKDEGEVQAGWGVKMSAQEALALFNLAEKPVKIDSKKYDIEELLRNQRCRHPQKNLMMAFEKNLGNDSCAPRFLSFDTSGIHPPDDDGPLPSLCELLSSTKMSGLQAADKRGVAGTGQVDSLGSLVSGSKSPTESEKAEAEFIRLTDELLKKNIEYLQKLRQKEKEDIFPSTFIRPVLESFQKVVPVIEKYFTRSAPVNIRTIIQAKRLPGIPCPFEEKLETVKTLEKLAEISGETKEYLINLNDVIQKSLKDDMETVDENLNSLEMALDGADENLEITNRIFELALAMNLEE